MSKSMSFPAVAANLILAVGLLALWTTFAPARLGGKVTYVIVNGNSMEPRYHLGDLAVMRKAGTYQAGDVVTYLDGEMQAYVIHRIIRVEQDRYVLQGDNNSWIDAYRPRNDEIIGKLWIHIPRMGNIFSWLRAPLHMALAIGVLGGLLMTSMIKPTRRGKAKSSPEGRPTGLLEVALYSFGSLALVFLGLSILAFLKPLTRPAADIQFMQENHFSYSATGTPGIYDTATVRAGEPVFPKLTCFLNIAFTYNLTGAPLQDVSGNYQLIARVLDEQSGWQRTIPMHEQTAFTGSSLSAGSTLDLCQILALVDTLKQETGLRVSSFTLEVIPQISLAASAMGNPVSESFEPKLVFRFDDVHFSLSVPKGQDDPLFSTKQSTAKNTLIEPNSLAVLSWKIRISTLRAVALVGLLLSLVGLGAVLLGTAQQSQAAFIRLKYGGLLVNVYERNLAPTSVVIDVTTIDELAKLAERHNTVILHMALHSVHYYMVQGNNLTYRYVFSAGRRSVAEIEPPRPQVLHYEDEQTPFRGPALNEQDLFDYAMIDQPSVNVQIPDTVLLKKIRL